MTRLTQEQKDANRLARNERDRAHRERRKLREAAEKVSLDAVEVEYGVAIEAADAAEDRLKGLRDDELREVDRQLRTLSERRKQVMEGHQAGIDAAHDELGRLWDLKRAATRSVQHALDTEFPDLVGEARWSSPMWDTKRKELGVA